MPDFVIPDSRSSCTYLDTDGKCSILKREDRLVDHGISIDCDGWCMSSISEKHFQQMARDISGRKI